MSLPTDRPLAVAVSMLLLLAGCAGEPEPAADRAAPTAGVLINEVRFLPAADAPAFVELANAGSEAASLDGAVLRTAAGTTIELPAGLTLAPGAVLALRFDDAAADPSVGGVQFPATLFAGGEAGALRLEQVGSAVDSVDWGTPDAAAVNLCRGGRCELPASGSVIARLPDDARAFAPAAWAPLDAELATPGAANPRPPVARFALLADTIFTAAPRYSWYSVPGAARYRLEVARNDSFAPLLQEAVVEATPDARLEQLTVQGAELPPGDYLWRVQALGASGASAQYSTAVPFSVDPSRAVSVPFDSRTQAARGAAAASPATAGGEPAPQPRVPEGLLKVLDVPVIKHAKDTRMLALEARREDSPWSWDTPDVAGYPYCARAGVAMLNAYYRGRLSQDRIGYEANKDLRTGPEYDLPVNGIDDTHTDRYSLPLALGTSGEFVPNDYPRGWDVAACIKYVERMALEQCASQCADRETDECFQCRLAHERGIECPLDIKYPWGLRAIEDIQREINADRPIIATDPGHLFLIVGYRLENGRFSLFYQDAGGMQEMRADAAGLMGALDSYWIGLAPVKIGSDEPEVGSDADGDGIVDFDEIYRFETDENKADSDGDGVHDKDEVRASVWDPEHGYHRTVVTLGSNDLAEVAAATADLSGRDFDRDGRPMEVDVDSDGGGCRDGVEDVNFNGERDGRESYNFDGDDDDCRVALGGRIEMRYPFVPGRPAACKGTVSIKLKFELAPPPEMAVPDDGVAPAYRADRADYEISTDGCEDIGGGLFDFWGGANVACNAAPDRKAGTVSLGPATTSDLSFFPLEPQLSLTLPEDAWLSLREECHYADGRVSEFPIDLVGSEFLNVRSGPNCETSERYSYGQGPELLDFCVEPAACNSSTATPQQLADCYMQTARFAAIPFAASVTKLGDILEGRDIDGNAFEIPLEDAHVRWEICRGCGDEFFD